MPDKGCKPNEFTFGILVCDYCGAGLTRVVEFNESYGLLPNKVVYDTIISGFCREGRNDDSEKLVEMMRGEGLLPDTVTFNSRISALCKEGKVLDASGSGELDKTIKIVKGMRVHVSSALGNLGNSYGGLVDDSMIENNCLPDLITYSTLPNRLCKAGRLAEAKKLYAVMM